ncbi:hypothetical protein K503DRAFT_747646 [Rhizopogon vinicolor AM-OR11-026]|uniref:Uncharacterized protein n=1 Tax=Rhizopogon vinicolor AM-OR11-026 TaxID=1314800 RepID=A0A1B7MNZ2_9AGAM|nr:hypothetical protein K503DRAFT_747646 [Rhizopogon vinicolor AM-OR11-026]
MRNTSANQSDAATGNYPPSGDTTSSGGYGSADSFSPAAQRGSLLPLMDETSAPRGGPKTAISQSTTGTDLTSELEDAKQGTDEPSRREMHEHGEWADLNPYGQSTFESREEAKRGLGERYRGHGDV